MKKVLNIILSVILCLSVVSPCFAIQSFAETGDETTLKFKNGKFRILVFADPQDDLNPCEETLDLMYASIEAARAGEAGRGFAVVASEIGDLATQTLDTVSTIDEIVGEVNSSVSNMTECLTTIMEFLEQTVLGDYEHFAQVGEQYHADADTFQQIMQQTKEAVDALEQHIGEISSTVSEINSMVEQSTDGISGIAEKSGSTQNLVTEGYDKLQECTQSVNVIRDFVAQFHLD